MTLFASQNVQITSLPTAVIREESFFDIEVQTFHLKVALPSMSENRGAFGGFRVAGVLCPRSFPAFLRLGVVHL